MNPQPEDGWMSRERDEWEIAVKVDLEVARITTKFQEEYELETGQILDGQAVFNALRGCLETLLTQIETDRRTYG